MVRGPMTDDEFGTLWSRVADDDRRDCTTAAATDGHLIPDELADRLDQAFCELGVRSMAMRSEAGTKGPDGTWTRQRPALNPAFAEYVRRLSDPR